MASTLIIYEGNGTTTDFAVPFDYLKKTFVRVTLGTTILTGGDYGDTGADYYFLDKTNIRLKKAPATGESLTVRRYTSATERVVTFKDASILKATDLDTSQLQSFHIAEEARDILNDSLSINREGNWDAKGHRIINVGDPVADTDAVNLAYYKKDADKVQANRDEVAKLHEEVTEMHSDITELEVSAKESAATAKASAGTAVSAQSAIEIMHQSVEAMHQSTQTLEASAKVSEANAKISEDNAKTSEENAKASEEVVVATGAKVDTQYKDIVERSDRVEEIGGALEPIAPEIKIVADNIDHVVTDSSNIEAIKIVGGDLEGSFSGLNIEDFGYITDPPATSTTITGGNIKIVADNIDLIRKVAALEPQFDTVVNSVETVTNLTNQATQSAKDALTSANSAAQSATSAQRSAEEAEDSANSAASSATEANTYATNAKNSATSSQESAVTATNQATAAKSSADSAKIAKDDAETFKNRALEESAKANDSAISAQKYAEEAKGYADQASSGQLQADWAETDTTAKTYIKNKPVVDVTKAYVDDEIGKVVSTIEGPIDYGYIK